MGMDLAEIGTLSQLAAALDQLRRDRSLSLRGLADAATRLPPRGGRRPTLPRSTASGLVNAKSVPEVMTVVTFLAACGIHAEEAQRPWLQALDRVANQHRRCPPGAVRVRDALPRSLGVHAAIEVDQPSADDALHEPLYVPRDFDADLRAKISIASQTGGFVLVTGDSSVGKTRALFEAVRSVLPDWWLLHPGDAERFREFAVHPVGRTVVWLDELQYYLDDAGGVPVGQVRDLIAAGAVLVATCWPDEHSRRVALPVNGQTDPYASDRRLLDLADVLTAPRMFSTGELQQAEVLAGSDRRIRVALDTPDAGFTQVMAAGPALIRQWRHAPTYAKAVITAALDARRVGAHTLLTREFLDAAAPAYLSEDEGEIATAPRDWLDGALAYATRLQYGAAAALTPVGPTMGRIAGYRVADFLHQHALRARRTEVLPDIAWRAVIDHHHADDIERIIDNAERRGRDYEAEVLYLRLIDNGDDDASNRLSELLVKRGRVDALRTYADNGNEWAAYRLSELLAKQGGIEELRTRADNGDRRAAYKLAELIIKQESVEAALPLLRTLADKGNDHAARSLAYWLADYGYLEELRARANHGDGYAAVELAKLLDQQGKAEVAISLMRIFADDGFKLATYHLAGLLAKHGCTEELRTRANSGDYDATVRLAGVLHRQGQVEAAISLLRPLADDGDKHAAFLLTESGDAEKTRTLKDDQEARFAIWKANLLIEQGEIEFALSLLRPLADNGDLRIASRLVDFLVRRELMGDLELEVTAGTPGAADALHRKRSPGSNS
ncbi:hypothetical protein [Amycolatopsis sp. NPDC003861]